MEVPWPVRQVMRLNEAQGVEEVPQVRARAVAVGMASLFRRRAVVMRTVQVF